MIMKMIINNEYNNNAIDEDDNVENQYGEIDM